MSTNVLEAKSALRKHYRQVRDQLSLDSRLAKQARISQRVKTLLGELFPRESPTVASYRAHSSEVSLDLYQVSDADFVFPRVQGDGMSFFYPQSFVKSSIGIEEPVLESKLCEKDEIDCVLVPGLAFDRDGQRLGYGRGFYDRWLAESSLITVGVAFSEQVANSRLPIESHDVPLHFIVTENYCFRPLGRSESIERVS